MFRMTQPHITRRYCNPLCILAMVPALCVALMAQPSQGIRGRESEFLQNLLLAKTTDRASAEPGDVVPFRILLRNTNTVPQSLA